MHKYNKYGCKHSIISRTLAWAKTISQRCNSNILPSPSPPPTSQPILTSPWKGGGGYRTYRKEKKWKTDSGGSRRGEAGVGWWADSHHVSGSKTHSGRGIGLFLQSQNQQSRRRWNIALIVSAVHRHCFKREITQHAEWKGESLCIN